MTCTPQQCAFTNTVLPASGFAKSHQALRNAGSSEIISWGEGGEEEKEHSLCGAKTSGAKIFTCKQLRSQQICKCGQTVDKSIWTERPGVQLRKATKCSNTTCSYSSSWTDIHTLPSKEKQWSYHSEEDPHVLRLTYAPSLAPILVELIFAIGALLPLQCQRENLPCFQEL